MDPSVSVRSRTRIPRRAPVVQSDRCERQVVLGPLVPGDADTVRAVFDGMSARSRLQRFLTPTSRLSRAAVVALSAVDGRHHAGVVAYAARPPDGAHAPIGIARYYLTAPGRAEAAVAVVDDWQGCGVGTSLVRALADDAERHGVVTVHGAVLVDNRVMRHILVRELVDVRTTSARGIVEFEGRLP